MSGAPVNPSGPVARLRALLKADLLGSSRRANLVRSTLSTIALKVAAALLSLLASIVFARMLGAGGYGTFALVSSQVAILTLVVALGIPRLLVREGAKSPSALRELLAWADRRIGFTGLIAAALLTVAGLVVDGAIGSGLLISAPIPLALSLANVRQAVLQSRGDMVRGQWPSMLLWPAATLGVFVAGIHVSGAASANGLFWASTASAALVLAASQRMSRDKIDRIDVRHGEVTPYLADALPFMWLGMFYLLHTRADTIMIGWWMGTAAAGTYNIASRAAEAVAYVMLAANTAVSPALAELHHAGRREQMQRAVTGSTRRAFALTLPLAAAVIGWAPQLLALLFGDEFADGAGALRILATSLTIVVATGPVATILQMTSYERLAAWSLMASVVLGILLNALLIPLLGLEGAALATGVSLVSRNLFLLAHVRRKLGIRPSILGA